MPSAIQYINDTLKTIESSGADTPSFQKALYALWIDLEDNLKTVTGGESVSSIQTPEIDHKLDEIIDAQDHIAMTACQSRAKTFEDLLYKLAIWRSDTPDFETIPIYADRKDQIVYSVFRDLIKITGIDHVKTKTDKRTNFLEMELS